ncbi:MAG: hypothetical protein Q7S68_04455 [Deltaproteobacteria bacterium]|nr:hypothetical protein [Deltaproteobacteria bacterium]
MQARAGIQPILSLESRLPVAKIKTLIQLLEKRFVTPFISEGSGKAVLEAGEELLFQNEIAAKKPKIACGIIVDGAKIVVPSTKEMVIHGSFRATPVESGFFDLVLFDLATPLQEDVISGFKEVGRLLTPEGRGLLVDYHPFGLFAKSGTTRLRSLQSTIRGVEDYFRICRSADLEIVDVREGFIDDTLRGSFTTPEEMKAFREIKGSPLLIFVQVKKRGSL